MVQELTTQPNMFGRLGQGIGAGLAEQIPKEVARTRLSSGLKELEGQQLTPRQFFTRASSVPGALEHPQLIQSLGELAKQENRGANLANRKAQENQPKPNPFQSRASSRVDESNKAPSLTKEKHLEQAQEGYVPPTQDEIFDDAGRRYEENPALYNHDPQKAIEAAENDATRKETINQAHLNQHERLDKIQQNVVTRLKGQSDKLGTQIIPANVYSQIEDKAIQATKSKKDGGDGLTEQQAMKKYGDELDRVAREYQDVQSVGNWGITANKPGETARNLKALEKQFYDRNDTENLAETLVSKNGFSYPVAYKFAEPVYRTPEANTFFSKLPPIFQTQTEDAIHETARIAPQLAKILKANKETASPLAFAEELKAKGYDPDTWMDYLIKNRDDLSLPRKKDQQLDKRRNFFGTLNDWWLKSWSGIEQ